jgi:hypothetical protein
MSKKQHKESKEQRIKEGPRQFLLPFSPFDPLETA